MKFLYPQYLFGLILAGLPVLVHLWYRRRLKRVPFSSLAMLRAADARRFGWSKLRDLLILALRCIFVAALFLALSKPQPSDRGRPVIDNRLASVLLIVDNSYSMGYGDNFNRAKKAAAEVIEAYGATSEFCVIALTHEPTRAQWTAKGPALAAVEQLELSYLDGSLKRLLDRLERDRGRYDQDIVYIGDGQESVFKEFPAGRVKNARVLWFRIPTGSNAGIARVHLPDPVAVTAGDYVLSIAVKNFSAKAAEGKVRIAARQQEAMRDFQAAARGLAEFDISLPAESDRGTVELLGDDSLEIDNKYYFSKNVPRRTTVLLIGENRYLDGALSSAPGPGRPVCSIDGGGHQGP